MSCNLVRRVLFVFLSISLIAMQSSIALAKPSYAGGCSNSECHSSAASRQTVSGNNKQPATLTLSARLDNGSTAALKSFTLHQGETVPLTFNVTGGTSGKKYAVALTGTEKNGTIESLVSNSTVRGIKKSLNNLLSFSLGSGWNTKTSGGTYFTQGSYTWGGTATSYICNMTVGVVTPEDVYTLTMRTAGKDNSLWETEEEILLNVLPANNSVIGTSVSTVDLGRMLATNMKTQTVAVNLKNGTTATGFSVTGGGGVSITNVTNSTPGGITATKNGSFTVGIPNSLGTFSYKSIAVKNSGDDGTGACSYGTGLGTAQTAINLAVSGTVLERRTFAPLNTVDLGNVLKGSSANVAVTSNNANSDSNHATSVLVNKTFINSGNATNVQLPILFNTYETGLSGSTVLPVVTAESSSVGDTAPYSDIHVSYTANVGHAVAASGLSQPGVYGSPLIGSIGNSFTGLSSKVTGNSGDGGALGSEAQILAIGSQTLGNIVQMQWRTRGENELPGNPNCINELVSDVVDLIGVTGAYVLQMSFNDTLAGGSLSDSMFLASKSLQTGAFENTIVQNSGVGSDAVQKYDGSWADFIAAGSPGNGKSIENLLGSWGIDKASKTAWAVVDHNSEFAVAPEPSTLLMLILAGLSIIVIRKTNKR